MALLASITIYCEPGEARRATRRLLRLNVPASASGDATEALIHNISERGFQVETATPLEEGDTLIVELPQAGATAAVVIWARGCFAGCQFENRISKAAISAGLLKAAPEGPPYAIAPSQPRYEEADLYRQRIAQFEEGPLLRAMMIVGLIVGAAVAVTFIVALASFPFST